MTSGDAPVEVEAPEEPATTFSDLGLEGPVLKALDSHKRYIRGEIAHRVNLKYAPDIRFRADESFAEAERIDALLDSEQVRRDTLRQPLKIDQDDDRDDDR